MKTLVIASILMVIYAAPVLACDCDRASAIVFGLQDRLQRPFLDDPQSSQEKTRRSEAKAPKQEAAPEQGGQKEEIK